MTELEEEEKKIKENKIRKKRFNQRRSSLLFMDQQWKGIDQIKSEIFLKKKIPKKKTFKLKKEEKISRKLANQLKSHRSYSPPKGNIKFDIYKSKEKVRNFFGEEDKELDYNQKKEEFKMPWLKKLINEDFKKGESYGMLYNKRLAQTESKLKFASKFFAKATPRINFKYLKKNPEESNYDLYKKSSRETSRKKARKKKKRVVSEMERKLIQKKVRTFYLIFLENDLLF